MTADISPGQIMEARRIECELDPLYFTRYFMKKRLGAKMQVGAHHHLLNRVLSDVVAMKIPRLIINIPPGYTKTEQAVINFMAHGLAIEPRSRFMHLSYSDTLARANSTKTKDIVTDPDYQSMWARRLRADAQASGQWWTKENGGIYATSTMGQVTGFRAGYMDAENFTGGLLIDDPIKPIDVTSKTIRTQINEVGFSETVSSRLAVEDVPIVLIMQRLHYHDLSGYLLRGGSGEKWHHLNLPVIIDNEAEYPKENTHGIPIEHGLPDGWLWPVKHRQEHMAALKAHRRKWQCQYLQAPLKNDGEDALWTDAMIDHAKLRKEPWRKRRTVVAIDPAGTKNKNSDETGIVVASQYHDKNYSVDVDYSGRYSPAEWAKKAIKAYRQHDADAIVIETNYGGDMCESNLRNNKYKGRVIRVHAYKGKQLRAEPISALYELGEVWHNREADLVELETEMCEWSPKGDDPSPNRLDACVYALTELAGPSLDSLVF